MDANPDFADLFSEFNAAGVRYLVVGAHAVIHYTEPRYTKDLDVWVEPTRKNAERTWNALASFGAPLRAIRPSDFREPRTVLQIGVAPNRIDILTTVPGVRFPTAWKNRVRTRYGGIPIAVLGHRDLMRAKRTAGRPQDRIDLENLRRSTASRRRR